LTITVCQTPTQTTDTHQHQLLIISISIITYVVLWPLFCHRQANTVAICLNSFDNRTSPSDNSNDRWKRLCLV